MTRTRTMPRVLLVVLTAVTLAFGIVATDAVVHQPPAAHAVSCCGGFSYATGVSLHESVDWYGVIHYGFTMQPLLTTFIAAWLNGHGIQSAGAEALLSAYACSTFGGAFGPLYVAFVAICTAVITWYAQDWENAIRGAAYYGVCVTMKASLRLFTWQPSVSRPYVDSGSWCDRRESNPQHTYIVPPLGPNGSPTVPCTPYPECAGV